MLASMTLCFGLIFLISSCREAAERLRLHRQGIWTSGKVCFIRTERTSRGSGMTYPTFEFRDPQGKTWRVKARVLGGGTYSVGDMLPVRYLPERPEGARVVTLRHLLLTVALPLLASVASLTFGVLVASGVLHR